MFAEDNEVEEFYGEFESAPTVKFICGRDGWLKC